MLRALVLVLASFWLVAQAVHAQDADPEALIREGVELRQRGDDVAALERFRRAYELSPTPRAAAQVGLAHQALGQWVDADRFLREAMAATEDPWVAQYRAALESSFEAVRQQVGSLQVLGGPEGAEVRFGGRAVGVLPMREPVVVQIGTAALEVIAPGHHAFRTELVVRAGQLTRQSVELAPEPVAERVVVARETTPIDAEAAPRDTATGGGSDALWIGLGIAGAVLVVGAIAVGVGVAASDPGVEAPIGGSRGAVAALTVRF